MIEKVNFLKVTEAGEVYGSLFLDMTHDDDYFVDPSAPLFEGETIHFSYNVHSKETRYFLKSGVYAINKKKKFEKVPKSSWENSLAPLLEPRRYRIHGMNDQHLIYGAEESPADEEFSVTPFMWSPKEGFHPLASGEVSAFNNSGYMLFNWDAPALYSLERGMIAIPVSEAFARSLNDRNQVVGTLYFDRYETHAFLWDSESGLEDLTKALAPDLLLTQALHISNDGSIVVIDRERRLYILHPAMR